MAIAAAEADIAQVSLCCALAFSAALPLRFSERGREGGAAEAKKRGGGERERVCRFLSLSLSVNAGRRNGTGDADERGGKSDEKGGEKEGKARGRRNGGRGK